LEIRQVLIYASFDDINWFFTNWNYKLKVFGSAFLSWRFIQVASLELHAQVWWLASQSFSTCIGMNAFRKLALSGHITLFMTLSVSRLHVQRNKCKQLAGNQLYTCLPLNLKWASMRWTKIKMNVFILCVFFGSYNIKCIFVFKDRGIFSLKMMCTYFPRGRDV